MISECGASLWCDPRRWVPEAARLLRPGGRLVFHTISVLAALCQPDGPGPAGTELLHPQREVHRLRSPGGGVEFHPGHGEWIAILRTAGFTIEALHEHLRPARRQRPPLLQRRHRILGTTMAARGRWAARLPA